MKFSLPPAPRDDNVEARTDWFNRVREALSRLGASLTWAVLDKTGSNLLDIETRNHNDLQNIQGGTYHLSSTDYTDLTDGGATTLHTHELCYKVTATLDFASITSNSTGTITVTVTGATIGYPVLLGAPGGLESGLIFCGYVSAADTVTIRLHNVSGGSIDPANATWTVAVLKTI